MPPAEVGEEGKQLTRAGGSEEFFTVLQQRTQSPPARGRRKEAQNEGRGACVLPRGAELRATCRATRMPWTSAAIRIAHRICGTTVRRTFSLPAHRPPDLSC